MNIPADLLIGIFGLIFMGLDLIISVWPKKHTNKRKKSKKK